MEAFAGESGLLPEQVWDAADIPARELFNGHASGSARPLVWAHAEYVKMCRSLDDGRVFDQPLQTAERYLGGAAVPTPPVIWRFNNKVRVMPTGRKLRIEALEPAVVHWGTGDWKDVQDVRTWDTGLGVHVADLDTASLPDTTRVVFTFYWPGADRWEGSDYSVEMSQASEQLAATSAAMTSGGGGVTG
jgi:glucoamylase